MTKNLLVLLAVAGFVFTNSGCTSKKADEEQQVVENADVEKIEADASGLNTGAQATDPSLEAALGGDTTATPSPTTDTSSAPTMSDASLNNESSGVTDLGATGTTTETTTMTTTDGMNPPVVDTTTTTTTTETSSSMDTSSGELTETPITDPAVVAATLSETKHSKKSARTHVHHDHDAVAATPVTTAKTGSVGSGSMQKVSGMTPHQGKDGAWINTIYIAHPKEKLVDISMKIFGTDKSADLKKIAENSYLKSRSVRAGDKIYYTSPNRPDDSAKMMLYYEDMGMVPETYVAKKGESLRKVSKQLLGYDNAWKEVWLSNGIDSKTTLKDGDTIRYWKDTGAIAANPPPAGGATLIDPQQAPAQTGTPPPTEALPPPPESANANLPPPPDQAAGANPPPAEAGLPPPPPAEMAPPPPPPPEAVAEEAAPKKKVNLDEAAAAEEGTGLDSDTMMSMGALGVLVALLAFVIIRKKKQKAAAAQMANNEINA